MIELLLFSSLAFAPLLLMLGVIAQATIPVATPAAFQSPPEPTSEVKPLDWFLPDERELARHTDPEAVRLLGLDMQAKGQLADVLATADRRLIAGHGRLLAARAVGMKSLRVRIYPAGLSDTMFRLIRASENLQRKDLSGYEKYLLAAELMCGNQDWTQADLAKHLNLSPALITKLLSPAKLPDVWKEHLRTGAVSIADCYAASRADPASLDGLLALKLSGAGREALEEAVKKQKNAKAKDAVRASKVKCLLPSGVSVIVSGEGVTLDEGIDALLEATKEMKRARDLGYTAKTFAAAMSDKARKS